MNELLSKLHEKLANKRYRESFVASVAKRMIPAQIRRIRKQRDMTQATLAKASNLTQGVISRAEDSDYGNLTVNTLIRVAGGFDCAFVGRFVPFSELARWYVLLDNENCLEVPCFADDTGFTVGKPPTQELLTAGAIDSNGIQLSIEFTERSAVMDREKRAGVISIAEKDRDAVYRFAEFAAGSYSKAEGM
ncbi:MAG: helix-turn-helix domain-containing protein [Bryobacteraceae bacterium]